MIDWISAHILTLVIFLPLFFAGIVVAVPNRQLSQSLALAGSLLTFVFSLHLWCHFQTGTPSLQFVEKYNWIPSLGIEYFVGIDGLNLLLVLLTTFLTPCVLLSLWNGTQNHFKAFLSCLLLLESGMIGALVAFDLLFFYVFWEVMLIPMYFIIGIWGGANRIYATTKFIIYTFVGSLLMLIAAITLYILHQKEFGFYSTNLLDLYKITSLNADMQNLLFLAFALAFAIKVPIWPFHTWLPHAHTEAPTSGSVILAGIMLKMGTYGFLRFALPLFPMALMHYSSFLLALGVIGIIYGALMAWMQEDAKKLVAYSSVSHLGFVVIGSVVVLNNQLSEEALTGALYQMINHGVSTGALFFLVGMIYERRHTRNLCDFGGLANVMPWFSICLILATLGSIGLPGTGGFIGEFLILLGVFKFNAIAGILASSGVVLGAIYMLNMVMKILFGPLNHPENKTLKDMSLTEKIYLIPLCALILIMGIYPNLFLDKSRASIQHLAEHLTQYRLSTVVQNTHVSEDALLLPHSIDN